MTVKLPKDAAGREIPLDTTKLFDACADAVMRDVASRIRNLRGED